MQKKKISKNTRTDKKKNSWTPWHYLIIAGAIIVVFFSLRGNYGLIKYFGLQKQKRELVRQISELQKQQYELEQEIDRLTNNYRYIEKIVREKYKMGKNGDKIFLMISRNSKKESQQK